MFESRTSCVALKTISCRLKWQQKSTYFGHLWVSAADWLKASIDKKKFLSCCNSHCHWQTNWYSRWVKPSLLGPTHAEKNHWHRSACGLICETREYVIWHHWTNTMFSAGGSSMKGMWTSCLGCGNGAIPDWLDRSGRRITKRLAFELSCYAK